MAPGNSFYFYSLSVSNVSIMNFNHFINITFSFPPPNEILLLKLILNQVSGWSQIHYVTEVTFKSWYTCFRLSSSRIRALCYYTINSSFEPSVAGMIAKHCYKWATSSVEHSWLTISSTSKEETELQLEIGRWRLEWTELK